MNLPFNKNCFKRKKTCSSCARCVEPWWVQKSFLTCNALSFVFPFWFDDESFPPLLLMMNPSHLFLMRKKKVSSECVRNEVRDTDSDYLMRKPSRCWLGAVPRHWNVEASCFHFISFVENTSAPLAPRAGISSPILLLFILFCCS